MRKENGSPIHVSVMLVVLAAALAGCSQWRPSRPVQSVTQSTAFVAPTLVPSLTPTATVNSTLPTQIPDCTNVLSYISDLSIPDGTHFTSGTRMKKQWQVKNSGSCNWIDGYTIQLVDGEAMGAKEIQDLPPTNPGAESVVEISFTAPQIPGEHKSSWQAFDSDGKPFGDKVFIQIFVNAP